MVSFYIDRLLPKLGFIPTSLTDTAVASAAIDRTGFNTAVIKVCNNAGTDLASGTLTITLTDGATNTAATAVTLATAIPAITLNATSGNFNYYYVDLSGINKYFKVVVTPDLTATEAGTVSVIVDVDVTLCDDRVNPASGKASTVYREAV